MSRSLRHATFGFHRSYDFFRKLRTVGTKVDPMSSTGIGTSILRDQYLRVNIFFRQSFEQPNSLKAQYPVLSRSFLP